MNINIMNINILAKATLVVALVVAVSFSVMKLSKASTQDCGNVQTSLTGTIISTGEFGGGALAIVTNSSDCSFNVNLADYRTSDNSSYDSASTIVGPLQSIELHINVPDCQYRLVLSSDSTILNSSTVRSNVCVVTSTPTPTPTPGPSCTGNIYDNVTGRIVSVTGSNAT